MHHLATSVHTSVRAAGTNDSYRMIGDDAQCIFNTLLNRCCMALPLPAKKISAIVFNSKCITHKSGLLVCRTSIDQNSSSIC